MESKNLTRLAFCRRSGSPFWFQSPVHQQTCHKWSNNSQEMLPNLCFQNDLIKRKIRLDIRKRLLGLHQKPVNRIVFCRQKERRETRITWTKPRSHRPCLKMTGYLFVIALPCDRVFSFNHALLTERKDSVNGTWGGFMVWGEALRHYRVRHKVLKDYFALML